MNKWYSNCGLESDVVVATRIRLARNISGYPFPGRMDSQAYHQVEKLAVSAVMNDNSVLAGNFHYLSMEDLPQTEAVSLVERHLVSPEFIADRDGRGLLLNDDESVSMMVNTGDHMHLQVLRAGMDLKRAYDQIDSIDTTLDKTLHFAFDPERGFLTHNPDNLGTGMRASLMLHLPAITDSGAMPRIASNLAKLGLSLRGIYGASSESESALYLLSNQVSLGITEEEAINNLTNIAMQLVQQERSQREEIVQKLEVQDRISRSLGILQTARVLSTEEFMRLISNVRFGLAAGMVERTTYEGISALIIELQPATLMQMSGKRMSQAQRDALRAEIVRKMFSKIN